jgi:hypothetical protein
LVYECHDKPNRLYHGRIAQHGNTPERGERHLKGRWRMDDQDLALLF